MHNKPNTKTLIFAKESLFLRQLNDETGEQQQKSYICLSRGDRLGIFMG